MSTARAQSEGAFWKWYVANEERLFHFDEAPDQGALFDELSTAMAAVHPDLTFEFGPVIAGKREFVISASGIKEAFPAVEKLYATAPQLPRWIWVKFRPRRTPMDITFGDRSIRAEDVRVHIWEDPAPDKLGLVVVMKGYTEAEDELYGQVAYLLLDQALGEYDIETKVGGIELRGSAPAGNAPELSLGELPVIFDAALRKKVSGR